MKKIKLICKNCNNEFERYKSYVDMVIKKGSYPNFCCKKCQLEYQNKQVKYITFVCQNCGEKFQRTERQVKNAESKNITIKFCSKKCKSDYWGKNRVEVICNICGKCFLKQKKDVHDKNYCSKECYAKYRKTLYTYKICLNCNKEFKIEKTYIKIQQERNQKINFCCKECQTQYQRKNMIEISCEICNKPFLKNKNKIGEHNFCSSQCRNKFFEKFHQDIVKCKYCGNEFITTKYKKDHGQKFCNLTCFNEYRKILKQKYKDVAHYLRSSNAYCQWRINVLKKANYKCEKCGSKNNIQAHHIKTLYSIVEEHSFKIKDILNSDIFNDIDNGKCLCEECHRKIHPQLLRAKNGQFCRLEPKLQKTQDD